jgi:hypothetical protein
MYGNKVNKASERTDVRFRYVPVVGQKISSIRLALVVTSTTAISRARFKATCLAGLNVSLTLTCLMWPRHGSLLRLLSVSALSPAVLAIWPFPERQYKVEGWIDSGQLGLDIKGSVVALGDWDGDQ